VNSHGETQISNYSPQDDLNSPDKVYVENQSKIRDTKKIKWKMIKLKRQS